VHVEYFSEESAYSNTAMLETLPFNLLSGYIKAIKVDADNENVKLQLSINNSNFYDINSYNLYEKVKNTDSVKIRVITESPNTIRKLLIIVNTNIQN